MKIKNVVNIVLVVAIAFLSINLLNSSFTGHVTYEVDLDLAQCFFHNGGKTTEIPVNQCCYQILNQLACEKLGGEIKCYTVKNSDKYFLLNEEMFKYCQAEGYDVQLE